MLNSETLSRHDISWVRWHMPVISSLGKLRQEDVEFLATLSYQTELKSSVRPSSTSGKRDSGGGGREVSSCVGEIVEGSMVEGSMLPAEGTSCSEAGVRAVAGD